MEGGQPLQALCEYSFTVKRTAASHDAPAACAKPLGQDAPAHCVNCRTRYCGDRCLRYHAHRGGHDENCDEIASGGGAEQHHANKKYEEAAAEAVEECAEDTEGQTCYICLEDGARAPRGSPTRRDA